MVKKPSSTETTSDTFSPPPAEVVRPPVEPGGADITLFVVHDMAHEDAKRVVVDAMGIQAAASDDVPLHVIETGVIEAQTFRSKIRPSPCGNSIGHYKITAGTQGCLAT